jgi:hypothetical protein
MAYIPHGADQQGRRKPGVWTSDDIGRSTRSAPHPAHPDGAHAASELQGAVAANDSRGGDGDGIVWLVLGACALLAAATLLHWAAGNGWL